MTKRRFLTIASTVAVVALVALPVVVDWRADAAQLPISELIMNYATLRITARELRGGAIVFLAPKTAYAPDKSA